MNRPQWVWRLEAADGSEVTERPGPVFTNQYDAEQWLGETWRSLAAQGAASARLLHDGAQVSATVAIPAPTPQG